MKKVTFEDLYSFTDLSDIAVSPDEQKLVFSLVKQGYGGEMVSGKALEWTV